MKLILSIIVLLSSIQLSNANTLEDNILNKNHAELHKKLIILETNVNTIYNKTRCENLSKHPILNKFAKNTLSYDYNFSPLMLATLANNEYAVEALLSRPDIKKFTKSKKGKVTALWYAAKNNHNRITKRLLGIDPDDLKNIANQYRIEIDLNNQKAKLLFKDKVINTSPISSGRPKKPTKKGTYVTTQKNKWHVSNIYNVKMPYFQRFDVSAIGLHAGRIPGYPASAGCVRLPGYKAKEFFEKCPLGIEVKVY